jgi:hypothetical protein
MGPRAGMDAVAKRKMSHNCSWRVLNHGRPAHSLTSTLTEPQNILYIFIPSCLKAVNYRNTWEIILILPYFPYAFFRHRIFSFY